MKRKIIKRLRTLNLKGTNHDIELGAKTAIFGGNASGKSAILDAIKLALLGEHDLLGKQGKRISLLSDSSGEMEAHLEFSNGEVSSFVLRRSKITHIGGDTEPAVRLNLCPEEFWGKGETARAETLLQMCGDSSMVTADFISSCIKRVRVAGMSIKGEESDLVDINNFAMEAKDTIKDGDISSLSKLEKGLADERTERGRLVKQLKQTLEQTPKVECVSDREAEDINQELQTLMDKAESLGRDAAKQGAECAEKQTLLLQESNLIETTESEESQMMYTRLEIEIGEIKEEEIALKLELKELGFSDKSTGVKYTEFSHEPPKKGQEVEIKAEAMWDGEDFYLKDETVRWRAKGSDESNDSKRMNELWTKLQDLRYNCRDKEREMEKLGMRISDMSLLAKARLEEIRNVDHDQNIKEINETLEGLTEEMSEIQQKLEQITYNRTLNAQRRTWEEKLERAERRNATIKSVLKTVRDVQGDVVNSVTRKILGTINGITQGILPAEVQWDGKTLGMSIVGWGGASWVSIDTFSGAEKAVTRMALGVALASKSGLRLAVLDEMSRLDKPNQLELLQNLNKAVDEGTIDQYICFCIGSAEPESKSGTNHIDLNKTPIRGRVQA